MKKTMFYIGTSLGKRRSFSVFAATVFILLSFFVLNLLGIFEFSKTLSAKELEGAAVNDTEAAKDLHSKVTCQIEEYRYWGRQVAVINPSLNEKEVLEIGVAIERYSRKYKLPPRLVVATIIVESHGDLDAVSSKGAVGLMQIMPWWSEELGIEEDLFSIDANIRVGCFLLSDNIRRWGYKEGILRYYRGRLLTDDAYFVKIQRVMDQLPGIGRG